MDREVERNQLLFLRHLCASHAFGRNLGPLGAVYRRNELAVGYQTGGRQAVVVCPSFVRLPRRPLRAAAHHA